ncbi:MAG: YHYH protein [Candidatus Thalassarchaeaceae archaeon]|jgi:hypothetical protein|nr:YHYH protein [Candidatus Thalassarchaeaceae archaeon]
MVDGKVAAMAALLVGILVFGGAMGFIAGMEANDDAIVTQEPVDDTNTTSAPSNIAPMVSVSDTVYAYGVDSFMIAGLVADETPDTVAVEIRLVDPINDSNSMGPWNIAVNSDGTWSIIAPITEPSEWVMIVNATDEEGLYSGESYANAEMLYPDEAAAELTMTFVAPPENSAQANIVGEVEHAFPETCTISFQPMGQDILPSQLIVDQWSIPLDYNATNHQGELIADCGLFSMTRTVVQYTIPELYEETPDADMDGFEDDDDDCDDTPPGEPVHSDGCSDSQRDEDGDGVSDADDQCPGHDDTIDVDGDGIPDGCDSLVDSDGDGISDDDDMCPGYDDLSDSDDDNLPDGCDDDDDNDGVNDPDDACPGTAPGIVVDSTGCPAIIWEPQDSWLCQDGQGPWVKDWNSENGYSGNNNGANSAGGGGSGPWFQCEVSVATQNGEMVVDANGIPNHDFLSTMGCCADEVDLEWHITLNPVNDTSGGHSSTDCPAAQGEWECAPNRGAVAVAVNGVPMYGPEEGPGGDAVALHFDYFDEDRQPIFLGWCTSHSAGKNFHYHYDAQCQFWDAATGEDMSDYEIEKLQDEYHSPIIGWAFDGYPIYGMYGYGDDGNIRAITSSYAVERTNDNPSGDQGYNGIDDWNYFEGLGDLDECNGRFGPTPEYPEGIYHYVSTPLSGSPLLVTDQSNNDVAMIGFPYFLLCYHGIADVDSQPSGGQGGGGPPPGQSGTSYAFMPENIDWKPPAAGITVAGWSQMVIELAQTSLILIAFLVVIPKMQKSSIMPSSMMNVDQL